MRIVPYQETDPGTWDAVVDGSAEAWLFHRHDWVAVESSHWTLENRSFALVDDGGRCIAVCPLYVRSLPRGWQERVLDTGHHRHTGPAFLDGLPPEVRKAGVKILMRRILEEGRRYNADRIIMNAHNLAPASRAVRQAEIPWWVMDYGFRLGLHVGPCGDMAIPGLSTVNADQILDLSPGEDELFRGLDTSFQRAIRKAVKAGLSVAQEDGEPVDGYYTLAKESAQRTGERLPPREYYLDIWTRFGARGECAFLFARHGGVAAGAILLLLYKGSANFLGGVSRGDYLAARVNNLLHWEAIRWARNKGCGRYRLGPVFPELPEGWPISRVSRFKGNLGAWPYHIIQGSLFLHPEKYEADGAAAITSLCSNRNGGSEHRIEVLPDVEAGGGKAPRGPSWRRIDEGLSLIMRCFGFQPDPDAVSLSIRRLHRDAPVWELGGAGENQTAPPLEIHRETAPQFLYPSAPRFSFRPPRPAYRTLRPFVCFSGPDLEPIWRTASGKTVIAWSRGKGAPSTVLLGLDVVEEIVRYRQGDPARADQNRAATGETPQQPERPHYLHEGQILPGYASTPWADRLGFLIAELCSRLTGVPLLEVLPGGANGAIILTGDDDQAFLENYDRQLRMIGGLPITYFLHHLTGHTRETIARMPGNVTYGFHPDALDNPSDYDNLCERQCEVVRQIVPGPLRVVRNHGFLHNGYLGHLKVWEKLGLEMDVNYPGTDGTALNGSFLPLRVRRRDGTWSDHYTLLTAFGDGMIQPDVTGLTEREAVRRIGSVVRQIERDCPAALVFNLHPQNVAQTRKLHDAVLALAERPGWTAVGLIEFLDWVILRDRIRLCPFGEGHWRISTPHPTGKAVLRAWDGRAWRKHRLDSWVGGLDVRIP